jgi:branched-chain amino acid aminotransferase/4-amino-4-deoxychorismate lyase
MTVPFDDRGLLLGDGLFETMLALDGRIVAFEAHMRRLAAGCETLGLPAPAVEEVAREAQAALSRSGLGEGRAAVRVTYTAGSGGRGLARPAAPSPRLFVTAAPAPLPAGPARLITASVRRNEGSRAARLKCLSYIDNVLARREAEAAGADEALMLNNAGMVACAAAANVFWLKAGRLFTPSLDQGVLDGIARREVIEEARATGVAVEEGAWPPEALAAADAAFLTNSLIGARPVAGLDGRPLGQQSEQTTVWLLRGRR